MQTILVNFTLTNHLARFANLSLLLQNLLLSTQFFLLLKKSLHEKMFKLKDYQM